MTTQSRLVVGRRRAIRLLAIRGIQAESCRNLNAKHAFSFFFILRADVYQRSVIFGTRLRSSSVTNGLLYVH